MTNQSPIKILIVGQTPPPYMGQALMIEHLINAKFNRIKMYHVQMSFSGTFKSVGKFQMKKIFHLFEVAANIIRARFIHDVDILFYPPAGPNRTPILRDIILLGLTRMFFKKVIYHFQAAGISEYLSQRPALFQKVAKLAYGVPQVSIQLSSLNPSDGNYFQSKKMTVVPNGLTDETVGFLPACSRKSAPVNILFVGLLIEDKGVTVLIEAARHLKMRTSDFQITVLGEFATTKYQTEIASKIEAYDLRSQVHFLGTKTGTEKWEQFAKADIFCFPSYFQSESFGNVLVEAMMFELPVVSTYWRGIPDIVTDGETGFLVAVKKPELVAEKLHCLIANPELRKKMGGNGRKKYLKSFSMAQYLQNMEEAIVTVNS